MHSLRSYFSAFPLPVHQRRWWRLGGGVHSSSPLLRLFLQKILFYLKTLMFQRKKNNNSCTQKRQRINKWKKDLTWTLIVSITTSMGTTCCTMHQTFEADLNRCFSLSHPQESTAPKRGKSIVGRSHPCKLRGLTMPAAYSCPCILALRTTQKNWHLNLPKQLECCRF